MNSGSNTEATGFCKLLYSLCQYDARAGNRVVGDHDLAHGDTGPDFRFKIIVQFGDDFGMTGLKRERCGDRVGRPFELG